MTDFDQVTTSLTQVVAPLLMLASMPATLVTGIAACVLLLKISIAVIFRRGPR